MLILAKLELFRLADPEIVKFFAEYKVAELVKLVETFKVKSSLEDAITPFCEVLLKLAALIVKAPSDKMRFVLVRLFAVIFKLLSNLRARGGVKAPEGFFINNLLIVTNRLIGSELVY